LRQAACRPGAASYESCPNEVGLVSVFYIRIDGPPKAHFTDGDNLLGKTAVRVSAVCGDNTDENTEPWTGRSVD